MPSTDPFLAALVRGAASRISGLAAASLLQRMPDAEERYGEQAFDQWRGHLQQRLLELAAAATLEEPRLFTSQVRWSRHTFAARGKPIDDLRVGLEVLGEILGEQLPEAAAQAAKRYLDLGLEALAAQSDAGDSKPVESASPTTLRYLEAVLEGDRIRALEVLEGAIDNGTPMLEAYESILAAAQRQIGDLWHAGEINVAEEHAATAITQWVMAALSLRADRAARNGRKLVAAAPSGNAHDMGLRLLVDLFELEGWRVILVGSDVPLPDLIEAVNGYEADLVLLSASLVEHLDLLAQTVTGLRQGAVDKPPKILVGGRAFEEAPELWRRLGADGYAATAEKALGEAKRLLAGSAGDGE